MLYTCNRRYYCIYRLNSSDKTLKNKIYRKTPQETKKGDKTSPKKIHKYTCTCTSKIITKIQTSLQYKHGMYYVDNILSNCGLSFRLIKVHCYNPHCPCNHL